MPELSAPSAPDAAPLVARDRRVPVPGGTAFVRDWRPHGARGAPIVLLHDSIGCVEMWRDFPAALAAATARRVIAYDRLGFGRSDPYPGKLPPDFIAREGQETLPAVLAALDIGPFVLCGHSVGGGMALAAAAGADTACVAVIAMSAQTFVEDTTLDGVRAAQRAFVPEGPLFARLVKYHGDKTGWALDAWIGTWLDPAFAGWTLAPALARLRRPALVLHGDRDEYGTRAHPEMVARLVPGARIVLLETCGHIPYREHPARVLDLAAAFLGDGVA